MKKKSHKSKYREQLPTEYSIPADAWEAEYADYIKDKEMYEYVVKMIGTRVATESNFNFKNVTKRPVVQPVAPNKLLKDIIGTLKYLQKS